MTPVHNPAPPPPAPFTCPHYTPLPGSKRCKDYQEGGTCTRPDMFLCSEWLKRNAHRLPVVQSADVMPPSTPAAVVVQAAQPPAIEASPMREARDLFGNPIVAVEPSAKPKPTAAVRNVPPPVKPPTDMTPTIDTDRLRGLTTEDILSFKALGVEVELHSEVHGELWLVPAYTGKPRREITPENAATVMRVLSVFPGSHVVAFKKTPNPHNHERPERPEKRS